MNAQQGQCPACEGEYEYEAWERPHVSVGHVICKECWEEIGEELEALEEGMGD